MLLSCSWFHHQAGISCDRLPTHQALATPCPHRSPTRSACNSYLPITPGLSSHPLHRGFTIHLFLVKPRGRPIFETGEQMGEMLRIHRKTREKITWNLRWKKNQIHDSCVCVMLKKKDFSFFTSFASL